MPAAADDRHSVFINRPFDAMAAVQSPSEAAAAIVNDLLSPPAARAPFEVGE